MTAGFVDHRRTERFSLQVPARIELMREGEVQRALELVTSDICSGGAYFHTDHPLPLGTEVKIDMILPLDKLQKLDGKHARIRVSGEVIRATDKGMAICFEDDFVISPWREQKTEVGGQKSEVGKRPMVPPS